jgi:hypothetical protein
MRTAIEACVAWLPTVPRYAPLSRQMTGVDGYARPMSRLFETGRSLGGCRADRVGGLGRLARDHGHRNSHRDDDLPFSRLWTAVTWPLAAVTVMPEPSVFGEAE